jgi:hypothetical protein
MELKLNINGLDTTFVTPFLSARKLRETIVISEKLQKEEMTPEQVDTMADYVVDIFGNKFTRDQLYDGLASNELLPTITNCISTVMGNLNTKVEALADPNV